MKYIAMMVAAASASTGFGACPQVDWISNAEFDPVAYAGEWYEWKRHTDFMWEMMQVCSTQEFKLQQGSTTKMDLYYRTIAMFNPTGIDGEIDCSQSTSG